MHMNELIDDKMSKPGPIPLKPLPEKPLVSILMPNYNYGQYIGEAIESVLRQTYPNWELVICDDGSIDDSIEVIEKYARHESRIRYIAKENGGVASALNAAFRASMGDVIALLDSDDIFLPRKMELVIEKFRSLSRPGHVYHRMQVIFTDGRVGEINQPFMPLERGYIGFDVYRRGGSWRFIEGSANCFRREVAELLFPIDENLFRSEADGYLCILSAILTSVAYLPEVLTLRRVHQENLTGGYGDFSWHSLQKYLSRKERILKGVNDKLRKLGMPVIETSGNIVLLERETFFSLVDPQGSLSARLGLLWEFSGKIIKDDLYAWPQKLLRLFMGWTALLFPRRMRSFYLSYWFHFVKWVASEFFRLKTVLVQRTFH